MSVPRALFVDMDDTLIVAHRDAATAWRTVLAEDFADHFDATAAETLLEAVTAASDSMWGNPQSHRMWRYRMPDARREVARRACLATGLGDAAVAAALGDAFSAHRDRNMRLFEGTVEALEALRATGLRMALVTNGASDFQRAKIDRFGLERHFDYVLVEEEFGVGKPEDLVYSHLLERFEVAPKDAWMVGDNLEWEVTAPQRHGIRGIWFDGERRGLPAGSEYRPDAVITALAELLDMEIPSGS